MLRSSLKHLQILSLQFITAQKSDANVRIYALLALFTGLSILEPYTLHELHHLINLIFQKEVHGLLKYQFILGCNSKYLLPLINDTEIPNYRKEAGTESQRY